MMITATDIHKDYPTAQAVLPVLKGVSLTVSPAAFISLVGPSGAGKSTFLHVLGGLDIPTKGTVTFDGIDLYRLKEDQLCDLRNARMGFVFQFYHLLSEFTALENICMPELIRSGRLSDKSRRKALDLLEQVGLSPRGGHFPSQLSGGEKQRIAVARALMNDPQVLFCDEPTGNLDSETGAQIMALLKKINKQRRMTIIVVTHNQELAQTTDMVYCLKDGVLLQR
jgi:lipoprotein-releasing system ATP-binding protein